MTEEILFQIGGLILAILALGIIVNRVIEYVIDPLFKSDKLPWLKPWKWTIVYFQVIGGWVSSFTWGLDVIPAVLGPFGVVREPTFWGQVLTGVLIGGGSELWYRIFKTGPQQK